MLPESWVHELCCRYIHWGWAPHNHLLSVFGLQTTRRGSLSWFLYAEEESFFDER